MRLYINNKLLWARKHARIAVRGYYLFQEATVSFEEQIMSKDNYSCIFQKPKVVCLYYPSNISSHSESSGAKTRQNKTQSKTR